MGTNKLTDNKPKLDNGHGSCLPAISNTSAVSCPPTNYTCINNSNESTNIASTISHKASNSLSTDNKPIVKACRFLKVPKRKCVSATLGSNTVKLSLHIQVNKVHKLYVQMVMSKMSKTF